MLDERLLNTALKLKRKFERFEANQKVIRSMIDRTAKSGSECELSVVYLIAKYRVCERRVTRRSRVSVLASRDSKVSASLRKARRVDHR